MSTRNPEGGLISASTAACVTMHPHCFAYVYDCDICTPHVCMLMITRLKGPSVTWTHAPLDGEVADDGRPAQHEIGTEIAISQQAHSRSHIIIHIHTSSTEGPGDRPALRRSQINFQIWQLDASFRAVPVAL